MMESLAMAEVLAKLLQWSMLDYRENPNTSKKQPAIKTTQKGNKMRVFTRFCKKIRLVLYIIFGVDKCDILTLLGSNEINCETIYTKTIDRFGVIHSVRKLGRFSAASKREWRLPFHAWGRFLVHKLNEKGGTFYGLETGKEKTREPYTQFYFGVPYGASARFTRICGNSGARQ